MIGPVRGAVTLVRSRSVPIRLLALGALLLVVVVGCSSEQQPQPAPATTPVPTGPTVQLHRGTVHGRLLMTGGLSTRLVVAGHDVVDTPVGQM
jgi:hypothetical protein